MLSQWNSVWKRAKKMICGLMLCIFAPTCFIDAGEKYPPKKTYDKRGVFIHPSIFYNSFDHPLQGFIGTGAYPRWLRGERWSTPYMAHHMAVSKTKTKTDIHNNIHIYGHFKFAKSHKTQTHFFGL